MYVCHLLQTSQKINTLSDVSVADCYLHQPLRSLYVCVCVYVRMRLLLLLQLVAFLCSTQAFIAQCVVESCASHLHHSLQLMAPHQVVTLEGLEGGKE